QRVEVGPLRLRLAQQRLPEAHRSGPTLPSPRAPGPPSIGRPRAVATSASCWSRCSREGWVEVSVLKLIPLMAGVMKKAFIDCAARRSRLGIAAISPVIFVSAEARADGFWVRKAAERSAHSSR